MNVKQIPGGSFCAGEPAPAASAKTRRPPQKTAEQSRKTLLLGWLVSMIGIVAYCYIMLSSEPLADALVSPIQRSIFGWAAAVLIVAGLGLWLTGYIGLLNEAVDPDDSGKQDADSNS